MFWYVVVNSIEDDMMWTESIVSRRHCFSINKKQYFESYFVDVNHSVYPKDIVQI